MTLLLETIRSPRDLRRLPESALPRLAEEIREFLLTQVAKTGGHLASGLGVVELTIALHDVFDTPDRVRAFFERDARRLPFPRGA